MKYLLNFDKTKKKSSTPSVDSLHEELKLHLKNNRDDFTDEEIDAIFKDAKNNYQNEERMDAEKFLGANDGYTIIIGIFIFLACAFASGVEIYFYLNSIKATAIVESVYLTPIQNPPPELKHYKNHPPSKPRYQDYGFLYRYQDNNLKPHLGEYLEKRKNYFNIGETISIRYSTKNPSFSRVTLPETNTLAAAKISLPFMFLFFYTRKQNRVICEDMNTVNRVIKYTLWGIILIPLAIVIINSGIL